MKIFPRIHPLKLLVDLEDATEFAVEHLPRQVREIKVNAEPILLDRQPVGRADVENLTGRDVARHEVAVFWIPLFEKVAAFGLGNFPRIPWVLRLPRHPHSPPLAAGAFAHESQLVGPGDRGGMDLDELTVAIRGSSLIRAADRAARADHRHG